VIWLSVFTCDIEGALFGCLLGSYYESSRMNDSHMKFRYISEEGTSIKAGIIKSDTPNGTVYVEEVGRI